MVERKLIPKKPKRLDPIDETAEMYQPSTQPRKLTKDEKVARVRELFIIPSQPSDNRGGMRNSRKTNRTKRRKASKKRPRNKTRK